MEEWLDKRCIDCPSLDAVSMFWWPNTSADLWCRTKMPMAQIIKTVDKIRGRGHIRMTRKTMYRLSFARCNIHASNSRPERFVLLLQIYQGRQCSKQLVWFEEEDDDDDPQHIETYRSCFRYIAFESSSNWKLWEEKNFLLFWSNSTVLRVNSKRKHRKIDVSEPHRSSPKKCNRVRTSAFSTWCPTTGPSPAFCYQFLLQPRSNQDTLLLLRAKSPRTTAMDFRERKRLSRPTPVLVERSFRTLFHSYLMYYRLRS